MTTKILRGRLNTRGKSVKPRIQPRAGKADKCANKKTNVDRKEGWCVKLVSGADKGAN